MKPLGWIGLAALAVLSLVTLWTSLVEADAQLRPGCDTPGGARIVEGYAGGNAYPVTQGSGEACATTAPAGGLSAVNGDPATLTVAGGVIQSASWATAEDTHFVARLVSPGILAGLVVLTTMGMAAIIFH